MLVLPTVLLEAAWVLQSRYRLSRSEVVDRLTAICGQAEVTVISAEAVGSALAAYAQAGDFADLLHFALASEAGATEFVTFDHSFARMEEAGPDLQIL